jgi:hypothetical protein
LNESATRGSDSEKNTIPKLNESTHKQWFRLMQAHLEGKGIWFVISMKWEEYVLVKEYSNLSLSGENTPSSTHSTSSADRRIENIDKKTEWDKAHGQAKFQVLRHLTDDDQDLFDEYGNMRMFWEVLRSLYSKPSEIAVARYTDQLHNFE